MAASTTSTVTRSSSTLTREAIIPTIFTFLLGDAGVGGYVGTLSGWLTLLAVVFLARSISKGSSGEALKYEREANATLKEELLRVKQQLTEQTARSTALEATRSLEPIIADHQAQAAVHEERAAERHEALSNEHRSLMVLIQEGIKTTRAQMPILDLIAHRLGPDPNGHDKD